MEALVGKNEGERVKGRAQALIYMKEKKIARAQPGLRGPYQRY